MTSENTHRKIRYIGIAVVFLIFSLVSAVLSWRFSEKHREVLEINRADASNFWGGAINQSAPQVTYLLKPARFNKDGKEVEAAEYKYRVPASDIKVKLKLSSRDIGNMTFAGYDVSFDAEYTVENPFDKGYLVNFYFPIPTDVSKLDSFMVTVDGKEYAGDEDYSKYFNPGEKHTIHVSYTSRGLGDWSYGMGNYQGKIPHFRLELTTDFADIAYPEGGMTPTASNIDKNNGRAKLVWEFSNLVASNNIGIVIPRPLDIGKATSGILSFVPLALVFFLGLLLLITAIKDRHLHAMHYLFITAGFFVFHILMSYLVVLVPLGVAFLISTAVSAIMTIGYAVLIRKGWPVIFASALGLLLFQIGFSVAQFFPQIRGLLLALIIITGLGIAMALTARTDWKTKF